MTQFNVPQPIARLLLVEKLARPCPFCGATPDQLSIPNATDYDNSMHVFCSSCVAHGPKAFDDGRTESVIVLDAIDRWNKRP